MSPDHPTGKLFPRGLICIRAAVVVVLGTLILAASAQAAEAGPKTTHEGTSPAPVLPPPGETVTASGSKSEAPVETVGEAGGEAGGEEQASDEASEAEAEGTATAEAVAEAAPAPTPPVETPSEPASAPTPPVEAPSEPAPVPTAPLEAVREALTDPIHLASETLAPASPSSEPSKEVASSAAAPSNGGAEIPPPLAAGETSATVGAASAAVTPGATALSDSLATGITVVEPHLPNKASASSARAAGGQLTAAQRAADLNCELSGLSGPDTDDCTADWLAGQSLSSASPAYLTTAAVAARASTHAGGQQGGSSGGSRSVTPPPGPGPSGAFGSAAAGGCGVAPAGFFTVAGNLRLVAPRAMHHLRLSLQPWRTAFFVLIPERPG